MRTTITSDPLAGLSRDRLWTEADLAVLLGKRSIHEYLKRQGDFPSPVPLNMRGRRWRPEDVIAWIDRKEFEQANRTSHRGGTCARLRNSVMSP